MKKNYIFLLGFLVWGLGAYSQSAGADFTTGPLMNSSRIATHIGQSYDGDYIFFGGRLEGFISSPYTDIFNAESMSFTNVNMLYPHDNAILVRMSDGRFFFAGGGYDWGVPAYGTIEYYDPADNSVESGGTLLYPRMQGSGIQLNSGKLLLVGGWYSPDAAANAEIYDPGTETSQYAGALISPRSSAIVLPCNDGGAMIIGGYTTYGEAMVTNVEYYDPSTNSISLFAESIIEGETGVFTSLDNMHKKTPDLYQMPDGKYVFLAYQIGDALDYFFVQFDPMNKTFEKIETDISLTDVYSDGSFVEYTLNREHGLAYLLALDAETAGGVVSLVTADLNSGKVYQPDAGFTLPMGEYLLFGNMVFIPELDAILYAGVSSSNSDYFHATNMTYLITPDINVEIAQAPASPEIQLFPNPAEDVINVTTEINTPASVLISITDMTGRKVYNVMHHAAVTGKYNWQIPIGALPVGTYCLQMQSENAASSTMFMKSE